MSAKQIALGFAVVFCVAFSLRAQDGLVLRYDFDAGKGTAVLDKSGNQINGRVHGPKWMKREKGFALLFDGEADYVECGDAKKLQLPGPLTLSLWIHLQEDIRDRQQYVLSKYGWNLRIAPGGVVCFETRSADNKAWTNLASRGRIRPGHWHHLAVVYDPETLKESLYLDGALDNERVRGEGRAIGVVKGLGLQIGRYVYTESQYFKGMLDDLCIYARALSANEIASQYPSKLPHKDKTAIPKRYISFSPLPCFIGNNLVVNLDMRGLETLPFRPSAEITLRLQGRKEPTHTVKYKSLPGLKKLRAVFPAKDLPPGDHEIRATLLGPDRAQVVSETFAIRRPWGKYIGLARTPSPAPTSPAPAQLVLQNDKIRCGISPKSGHIEHVTHLPEGVRIVEENRDIYVFDGKRISEADDKVIGHRKAAEGNPHGFELVCTNPGLPDIELTKAFRLESDHLVKVVYFRALSEKNDGRLIFLRSVTQLDRGFHKDGWYYRPMWDGGSGPGSGTFPFIPGSRIADKMPLRDLHGALFIYVQPNRKLGCAQYKFKVNGYHEGFVTNAFDKNEIDDAAFFAPSGWEMYLTGDVIRKGWFLSVESHFMIFEGDGREFHRLYKQLPDYAAMIKNNVPDWYSKVKICSGDGYATLPRDYWWVPRTGHLLSTLAPDEYILSSWGYWTITGDYQLAGTLYSSWGGYVWDRKTTAAEMKRNLDRYRNFDPQGRLKSVLYTWYGSASDKSKTYMEKHPEWLLRRRDGNYQQYGSDEVYNYLIDNSTQDHMDFKLNQYRTMMKYFELDGANQDGGHGELVTYFPEKRFIHLYHQTLFDHALKRACEEQGKVFFTNGSSYPEWQHGGFFEYGGSLQIFEKRDWRLPANVAFVAKYTQQPNGLACLLTGDCQAVSNRNMMYGLLPFMRSPTYYLNISHMFLMLDLSFEVRNSQIVDGDHLHPNWWNFETTTLESALLKLGAGYLLPLINHESKEKRETVSVSLAGLNLKPEAPCYVWQTEPLIDFGLDLAAHIPESVDTVSSTFDVTAAKGDTLQLDVLLSADRLKMVTISQVPAFVYSVGGRRNHYFLNTSRGVEITGQRGRRSINLNVRSESDDAEILVYLEKGWKNVAVRVNGDAAEHDVLSLGEHRFAKLRVPRGASTIVLTRQRGAAEVETPLTAPKRYCYEDFVRGFSVDTRSPRIRAATKDGLPCWEMSGPGQLANLGICINRYKCHKGITFRLNPGDAKGTFEVKVGHPGKYYEKKFPLDFRGWKELAVTQDEFDVRPEYPFHESPRLVFKVPSGNVYVSDFRLIPFTEEDKAKAAARKLKRPKVVVPFAKSLPALDGMLNDECWKHAGRIEFAGKGGLSQTQMYLMYDQKNLYVAAQCGSAISSPPTKLPRDARGLCKAPNCEMFFMPKGGKMRYQMITTAAGARWDGRYEPGYPVEDIDWNPDWKVAVGFGWGMCWRFEAAIPFASFEVNTPGKGDVWLGGFFRQSMDAGLLGWGGIQFHNPDCYGELVFAGEEGQ